MKGKKMIAIKQKAKNVIDKLEELYDEHPVAYIGISAAIGVVASYKIYNIGYKAGSKCGAGAALTVARAACDDDTFEKILKAGNLNLK